MDETIVCEDCGAEVDLDDSTKIDGRFLCDDCASHWYNCESCSNWLYEDDAHDYHGEILCQECYDQHFQECGCCGETYDYDHYSRRGSCWGDFCPDCSNDHFICDNCGETYHVDEYGGDGYCEDCYPRRHSGIIKDYHEGADDTKFLPTFKQQELYLGMELETDGYHDWRESAEDVMTLSPDEEYFWLEGDCSLDRGFELITHPATLEYHLTKFPWDKISQVLSRQLGVRAENSPHAAIHIHISRDFFGRNYRSSSLKMIYLVDKFRQEFLTTANTSDYLAMRSANSHCRNDFDRILDLGKVRTYWDTFRGERYSAVNLYCKEDTVELRFFRSTLDVNKILAYLELADYLARMAKNITSAQMKKVSWQGIVRGARQYQHLPSIIVPKKIRRPQRQRRPRADREEGPIRVGDHVRICVPEDQETEFTRGGATNDQIGVVQEIGPFYHDGMVYSGHVVVHFDGPQGFGSGYTGRWHGLAEELEIVERPTRETARQGEVHGGTLTREHIERARDIMVSIPPVERTIRWRWGE